MSQQARNNPEEARLEARRADMAMEEYQKRQMEELLAGEEEEYEPVLEAIRDAREWHEHCHRMDVLREMRQTE